MSKYSIQNEPTKCDVLIQPFFQDKGLDVFVKNLDKKFGGIISRAFADKDFEGKKFQTLWLFNYNKNLPRLLLIGLGKEKEIDIENWKKVVGAAIIGVQNKKLSKLALVVSAGIRKFGDKKTIKETVLISEVAGYAYDEYKTDKEEKIKKIQSLVLLADLGNKQIKHLENSIVEGQVIGESVNFARHLGNTPPTVMTPTLLAQTAVNLSHENKAIKTKVLSLSEITKLKMGCLLAVARGSEEEPKFIIAEYWGAGKKEKPTILVGKGITFDSGGLSLKPRSGLNEMKFDMLGAASVLGVVKAVAQLGLKKNLVALIPSCENMPSGSSYRPDDILFSMNGKSVEIIDTDAEGRLILADALCYAKKYEPKEVIDLATLTGACVVAIGTERSGLFTTEEKIAEKLLKAGGEIGEKLWRLPLGEEYSEAMKSSIADIKNLGGVGGLGYGGASTGAAFLQFFTDYPWAHIDLASALFSPKDGKNFIRHGANGFGVQTLIEYLRS